MKRQNRRIRISHFALCCLISLMFLSAFGVQAEEKPKAAEATESGAADSGQDIYSMDIKPLTPVECARCHYSVYMSIKKGKGAHKKKCTFCHTTFHNFRRGLTWDERVPHCQHCHNLPHGKAKEMTQCLKCHSNAHAPLASIKIKSVEPYCTKCHGEEAKQIKDHPSGHTNVACSTCHHDSHGYIPKCNECHEKPHTPFKNNGECLKCHNPHMPKDITYGTDVPNSLCAACHPDPYKRMESTSAAHGKLQCVFCHADKHGNIPTCQSCHSIPHAEKMIKKFGDCSKCHGNPHDLNMSR